MHIGIDARLPFFRRGGIAEYTLNLIEAIAGLAVARPDLRTTVIQARADRFARFPPGAPGFARFDVDTPCHHPWERVLLGVEIRGLALDVLHSPDFIPPASGVRRHVISVHDLGFLDYPEHHTAESRRHYAGQIAWALEAADHVVTLSEYVRRQLIDRFPLAPEKITAIHPAAAAHFARPATADEVAAALERHGLAPGFILHVGVLEPRKNLPMLMRAHDLLRHDGRHQIPLVLAGPDGWFCDEILHGIQARAGAVRHLGPVAPRDLASLYAAAAVLAVPSFHEGFSLPLIEAMTCGCPVIASTGGAIPEAADGAALLVDPADPRAWAEALSRLLDSAPLADDLRERGRARAARLSWSRTASAVLKAYDRVVA